MDKDKFYGAGKRQCLEVIDSAAAALAAALSGVDAVVETVPSPTQYSQAAYQLLCQVRQSVVLLDQIKAAIKASSSFKE